MKFLQLSMAVGLLMSVSSTALATDYYIRGSMTGDGWAVDEAYKMTTVVDEKEYTFVANNFNGTFKFAANDWDISFGNPNDNQVLELTPDGKSVNLKKGGKDNNLSTGDITWDNVTIILTIADDKKSATVRIVKPVTGWQLAGPFEGEKALFDFTGENGIYTTTFTAASAAVSYRVIGVDERGNELVSYRPQDGLTDSYLACDLKQESGTNPISGMTVGAEYQVTLSVTEGSNPTASRVEFKKVKDPAPVRQYVAWYVSGLATDWKPVQFAATSDEYILTAELTAKENILQFGVRPTKNGENANNPKLPWMANGSANTLGQPYTLSQVENTNCGIKVEAGKTYVLTLDVTDESAPVVTVTEKTVQPQPPVTVPENQTTIYFDNAAGWSAVKCYFYKGTAANGNVVSIASWENAPDIISSTHPDLDARLVTIKDNNGMDKVVYQISYDTADGWEQVVFHNGNDSRNEEILDNFSNQTADCRVENYGLYSNSKTEGVVSNSHYNNNGPVAYYVGGFYYPARQSASLDSYTFYYNGHRGVVSDEWDKCYCYILQGGSIIAVAEMEATRSPFGVASWKFKQPVQISSSLADFTIWFNNSDKVNQGANARPQGGSASRTFTAGTLQNNTIFEDQGSDTYRTMLDLYIKGDLIVNGESAATEARKLSYDPHTGRYYARVKTEGTGEFHILRSTEADNKYGNYNLWGTNSDQVEVLKVGSSPVATLVSLSEYNENHSTSLTEPVNYRIDNTASNGAVIKESLLLLNPENRKIQNVNPTPALTSEAKTIASSIIENGADVKSYRCKRRGGVRYSVFADNYFTDFSKVALKFEYIEEDGHVKPAYYEEPSYFAISEASNDLSSGESSSSRSEIGSYRIFFHTPGKYRVSAVTKNTNMYDSEETEMDVVVAYATPLSTGLSINYTTIAADELINPDDPATYTATVPTYNVAYFWSKDEDNRTSIEPAPALGSDIKADIDGYEIDETISKNLIDDYYYLVVSDKNARFWFDEMIAADPSVLTIWYKVGSDNEPADARRRVAGNMSAPAGYTRYDLLKGADLSAADDKNPVSLILDQEGTRSIPYEIKISKTNDVETEVEGIAFEDSEEQETVYYNLNGLRIDNNRLAPGIYVEVRGTQTRKIVVR